MINQNIREYLKDIQLAIDSGLSAFSVEFLMEKFTKCASDGKKVIFIGNGGSAAICGHMALDFTNACGIRAVCFNDGPLLTCLANDYGFSNIFSKSIQAFADEGDVLVAISSSGNSEDILRGVEVAKKLGCYVVTFSGFDDQNLLLAIGDYNVYVPIVRPDYGKVEMAHFAILHYICDRLKEQKSRQ